MSTWLAGRNARTPRLATRPPRTFSTISTSTGFSFSKTSCRRFQARSASARRLESTIVLFGTSERTTYTVIGSPDLKYCETFLRVAVVLEQLVVRQQALDLGADVDDDAVLREHDDLAGGDHPAVHRLARQLLVGGRQDVLHGDLVVAHVGVAMAHVGRRFFGMPELDFVVLIVARDVVVGVVREGCRF
jgi:hypothetical protein